MICTLIYNIYYQILKEVLAYPTQFKYLSTGYNIIYFIVWHA